VTLSKMSIRKQYGRCCDTPDMVFVCNKLSFHYNITTTVLWPFVQDYPRELEPEETFTQSHLP